MLLLSTGMRLMSTRRESRDSLPGILLCFRVRLYYAVLVLMSLLFLNGYSLLSRESRGTRSPGEPRGGHGEHTTIGSMFLIYNIYIYIIQYKEHIYIYTYTHI